MTDIICPVLEIEAITRSPDGTGYSAAVGGHNVAIDPRMAEILVPHDQVILIPARVRIAPHFAESLIPAAADGVTRAVSILPLDKRDFLVPEEIADFEGETQTKFVLRGGFGFHDGIVLYLGCDASGLIGAERA